MAPESERAKQPNGTEQRKYGDCLFCGFPKHQHIGGETCPPKETEYQTKPNEPTLTCSEVVERLRDECLAETAEWTPRSAEDYTLHPRAWFDTEKAEAILHSWRERRVQELEEALRELESAASVLVNENDFGRNAINRLVDARTKAEKVLAREQIRKGAKHE